jgi:pyridoxamine 5'-phosphate oxidase
LAQERQVAIRGLTEKISREESLAYFLTRPWGNRVGAWVSQQSQEIASRAVLEAKLKELSEKFKNGEVPLPDFWGGFRLIPKIIEFWQGGAYRLHDRFQYSRHQTNWQIRRLSP